jgi:hypothetical protein
MTERRSVEGCQRQGAGRGGREHSGQYVTPARFRPWGVPASNQTTCRGDLVWKSIQQAHRSFVRLCPSSAARLLLRLCWGSRSASALPCSACSFWLHLLRPRGSRCLARRSASRCRGVGLAATPKRPPERTVLTRLGDAAELFERYDHLAWGGSATYWKDGRVLRKTICMGLAALEVAVAALAVLRGYSGQRQGGQHLRCRPFRYDTFSAPLDPTLSHLVCTLCKSLPSSSAAELGTALRAWTV